MRMFCGPSAFVAQAPNNARQVILYGRPVQRSQGSAGESIKAEMNRRRLDPDPMAWDFVSIALSVVAADFAVSRSASPDGWTREIQLDIAVTAPEFWGGQADALSRALAFLTTDRWSLRFHHGGMQPIRQQNAFRPTEEGVVLLSGGLDSLVGVIDLAAQGHRLLAVSQIVRGDADKQVEFAARILGEDCHIPLNHNAKSPGPQESSQRARSIIFIALGVLVATAVQAYQDGNVVPLYICENGFIAINPPLTGGRIGSLSTRTAHPVFLKYIQNILDAAGIRVSIQNPYAHLTKGEMLRGCLDQVALSAEATRSTSCGRFQRFNYRHCGRCVPCQVRRAAFLAHGRLVDGTQYVYEQLGRNDADHAKFDDVRSVAIALTAAQLDGVQRWMSGSIAFPQLEDRAALSGMLERGLHELRLLHQAYGVR